MRTVLLREGCRDVLSHEGVEASAATDVDIARVTRETFGLGVRLLAASGGMVAGLPCWFEGRAQFATLCVPSRAGTCTP